MPHQWREHPIVQPWKPCRNTGQICNMNWQTCAVDFMNCKILAASWRKRISFWLPGMYPKQPPFFFGCSSWMMIPNLYRYKKKRCLIKDPLTKMLVEANIHQQKHLFKPTSINKNACLSQHPLKRVVVWSSGFDFFNSGCPQGGLWIASGSDEWRETCSPWFVCFR